MRQVHRAGDKLFIDYSGDTVPIINPGTGEIRRAEIFVAVLGASSYTYAEATWSQQLPTGSPRTSAASNSWAASRLCSSRTISRARSRAPAATNRKRTRLTRIWRDITRRPFCRRGLSSPGQAAVEASVLLVQRWILARLRHRQFFSLEELNAAIRELLVILNNRPFQKLDGCRRSVFETIDRPAMKPLPATRYEFAEWKKAIVNIDYHVEVTGHYYSVPHSLVRQKIEARFTATAVECFFKGNRVAVHVRSSLRGRHTTVAEHMPESHRKHMQWTPGRLLNWALDIGPATRDVVKWQLENRPHPEQGYRACLGLLNLAKQFTAARLEAACRRALTIGSPTRKSIKSILEAKLDAHPELFPATDQPQATTPPAHGNVRGADYFRSTSPGDVEPCSSNPPSIH